MSDGRSRSGIGLRGAVVAAAAALLLLAPASGAGDLPAAEPAASGLTLAIDQAQSALGFTIHRKGETIEGRAHEFSGEVTLEPERPGENASAVLRVKAASLETGNRVRDHKMRGSHLEVDRFPEIVYRSTSIRVSDGAGSAPAPPLRPGEERKALLEGVVSLHGVDRTILFPATIRYDNRSFTAEGDLTLSLTDHSIPIPRFLWLVLDDEVKVHFRFVAKPPAAAPAATPGTS